MALLEDRVDRLEGTFASFMNESAKNLAAIHESIAEIRLSNARTDRQLLALQQQANKMWEQAQKDRELAGKYWEQTQKDRELAERKRTEDWELAEMKRVEDRELAERKRTEDWELAEKKWAEEREQAEKKRAEDRELAEKKWAEEREQAEKKWAEEKEQREKERKDFNRRLAEVTDSQGLMIENMVWPNLKRIAGQVFGGGEVKLQGIRIKRSHPQDRGRLMELDLLAVGETDLLICEAKSKVGPDKVREFQSRVAEVGDFFPDYAGLRLWPMIASIAFDDSVVRFMTSQGVLALGFGDETMEIVNPEALQEVIRRS